MYMQRNAARRGFTLIELLVVIGILTILLAIVLVAINPGRQFAQSNNTKRRADVATLLNAIHQYEIDHRGVLPPGISSSSGTISKTGVDICASLVSTYTAQLPFDPVTGNYTDCSTYNTGYTVVTSTNNRVTVSAPGAELGDTINVTQ